MVMDEIRVESGFKFDIAEEPRMLPPRRPDVGFHMALMVLVLGIAVLVLAVLK